MAPSISDHVTIRARLIGRRTNMSSPRNTALPSRAPAMPWVMVSILRVYRMTRTGSISAHRKQRRVLRHNAADFARGNAVLLQHLQSAFRCFRGDGH